MSHNGAGASASLLRRHVTAARAAALGTLVGLAVLVSPASASAGRAAGTISYAALGDSYTAGPLIPDQLTDPVGCLRSSANYPHDAARALGLDLTDISCSGATTADMSSPQSVTLGTNPPQLSAVTSSTGVVSLGIGGNDIGFVSIIENCAALTPWGPTKVGWTCQGYYDPNGHDQIAAAINALAPKVAALIRQIHGLAPSAKIFVVGYPAILPGSGGGCWPQMPFESSDVTYLRAKEIELDQMLAAAAGANGANYVDTYSPSVNHSACASESTRWVEPLVPDSAAAPVHPNANGEAAMAGLLEAAMQRAGI